MTDLSDTTLALAFYLPQYHPIPENDAWWGAGFTEWANVVRGRPLFRGHYQPHLPADLGFYDLRVPEVREQQAQLARQAGLSGFVYYHYWFGGRRLLERPFQEVLDSGSPDFPFALCWANENWTRRWDGGSDQVLIGQDHDDVDDLAHLDHLTSAFQDPRYIRVDGKPLFLVYRSSLLPHPRRTTELWRRRAQENGVGDLFLVKVQAMPEDVGPPSPEGFDAALAWEPAWGKFGRPLRHDRLHNLARRLRIGQRGYGENAVYDYEALVKASMSRPTAGYAEFPCVTPSWDNSVRRTAGGGVIMRGSTPAAYGRWLAWAVRRAQELPPGHRLLFINAWNEWAEGNHLEPDAKWGHSYLEETAKVLASSYPKAPA